MSDETTAKVTPSIRAERTDNFFATYANSVMFEPTAWDLKFIFGQIEQASDGGTIVKQHLAVSVSWPQIKLALFWLRMQVEAMEEQSGKIAIRKDVLPPEPPPLTPEQAKDPVAKKFYESYIKAREEFLASL